MSVLAMRARLIAAAVRQRFAQTPWSYDQRRVLAHEEKPAAAKPPEKPARRTSLEEQARTQWRIAALERNIGQQQVEIDFSASLAASRGRTPAERRA
jgi:hypothetical protein